MWELSLLGLTHAIFGIILLLSKEQKSRADYLLVLWILLLQLTFLEQFITYNDHIRINVGPFLNQSFTILNGPFLYLYIREIIKKEDTSRILYWPHLILFLIIYIIFIIRPAPITPGGPINPDFQGFNPMHYFGSFNIGVFMFYGALSLKIIYKNNKEIKETFAYINGRVTLLWLAFLPMLFIVFFTIIIIAEKSNLSSYINIGFLHSLMFFFFMLYLIFFGLRQKKLYVNLKTNTNDKKKSSKIIIDDQLIEKIKDIMITKHLYRNPTLSVYDLAEAMNVSRHQLSALLNEKLSMNFFQFINVYRLEEVLNRIKEDKNKKYNIIELAYESGFNSKSSFNSLFKKQYEMTPTQYRNSLI